MGRLRTLTILLTIGVWAAATEGSPPDGSAAMPADSTRQPLKAPAADYLKGGIGLYQKGDSALAAKYLQVAYDYRDQLGPDQQAQLADYRARLNPSAAPVDPAVQPASTATATAAATAAPADPTATAAAPAASGAGMSRGFGDIKQEARWKLQAARDQMRQGNYDEASKIVAEVAKMPVKWGLFDETPAKFAEAIAKARPKMAAAASGAMAHDKKTALAKLKEAKDLLANNQFEQAEAIAIDVNSWGLSYSLFEEKPLKVAAAARALRKRDAARSMPSRAQPSPGVYDVLVSEARHLTAAGQYDQAEAKARQALNMGVVPSLTADRAEAVLNDIATARSRTGAVAAAPAPAGSPSPGVAEAASVLAEREANALLAKGQSDAAAAKFVEADGLKAREMSQPPAVAVAAAAPAVDLAVRRVSTPAEVQAPALDAPALPPTLDVPAAPPESMPAPPPSLSADAPPAGNKGVELLTQSKALFSGQNYAAAREKAEEAKAGGYGVEAQADEILAQVALSEQGGALAVYEAALEAIRGKPGTPPDFERARALLNEVASSGAALDEGMMQKVQDLLLKLPRTNKDGAGKATAADVPTTDAESLKAQQLNAEVGTKVAEARRMMETDPEKGIALLETTLASVKAADMPQAVARTMTRRLEVAIELAKKDKVGFDAKMLDKNAKAEIELKKLRILEADKAKKASIQKLMDEAQKAQSEGNYAKAEEYARRAQEIDPNELAPGLLAYKANLQRHYETSVRDKKDSEEGALGAWEDVAKAGIIDNVASRNGVSYPKSFAEMTARRRAAALSDIRPKSSSEVNIEKKLNEPITLNFKDMSLDEAITFIQNYTGLNVILDPKALNDEGLSRDSKVNIQANSIKLKSALKFMLRPLGLTYKPDDDVLLITSPQAMRDKTYSWTYPVADLVISPNKATPAQAQGQPFNTAAMLGADPASLQTMVQANSQVNSSGMPANAGQRVVTEADMYPLIQLITNTIAFGTWRVADPTSKGEGAYGMGGAFGGGAGGADAADVAQPGSITPFMLSISLIIRHTAEVHEEVAELLKQLRRLQDLQVSIEVRFITVSDDFFEQIGVDFDLNLQSNTVGKNTTFAAPNPAAALFPFNSNVNTTTSGSTSGGGTTAGSGGTTGNTGSGGGTGGAGGTAGAGGGAVGGGSTSGGGTAGAGGGSGGISGGGFAGGGGGVGGAGGFGGGTSGQGNTTTTGGATSTPTYLVNPFLDHSLGRRTPLVVGTSGGGIKNFTGDLGIPLIQGSASAIAPFNAVPGAGATLGISFLSDLEMYLFLTAAQGDARNNIVQAPKVTTFNGANAFITNQQTQSYIQALTPIVGFSSVAFTPQIGQLNDGVQLAVTPVVSSDRRYVRLSLAPSFNTVNGLQTLTFPAGAVGGSGLGGSGTGINSTIQLPTQTQTQINTTVTVPDGGTVLLGGVKRMREQRLEYGVPVLAKTPLINRLFRNVGIGRRTDSLMLMVTPKIIILEEEEARLGVQTVNPAP